MIFFVKSKSLASILYALSTSVDKVEYFYRIILRGGGGLRFLKPIEAGKCTMVCAALWNFVLHREGIRDENDTDYPEAAPVLGRGEYFS